MTPNIFKILYDRQSALDCRLRTRYYLGVAEPEAPPFRNGFQMRRAWPDLIGRWQQKWVRHGGHTGRSV